MVYREPARTKVVIKKIELTRGEIVKIAIKHFRLSPEAVTPAMMPLTDERLRGMSSHREPPKTDKWQDHIALILEWKEEVPDNEEKKE